MEPACVKDGLRAQESVFLGHLEDCMPVAFLKGDGSTYDVQDQLCIVWRQALREEDEGRDFDASTIPKGIAGLRQRQVWMLIEADGARELPRQFVGILY